MLIKFKLVLEHLCVEDEGPIHVRKYFLVMLKSHIIWAEEFGTYYVYIYIYIYIYTLRQKQIFIGKATDQVKNLFNRQRSGSR